MFSDCVELSQAQLLAKLQADRWAKPDLPLLRRLRRELL